MHSASPINKNLKAIFDILESRNKQDQRAQDSWKRVEVFATNRCRKLIEFGSVSSEFSQSDIMRVALDHYFFGDEKVDAKNGLQVTIALLGKQKKVINLKDLNARPRRMVTMVTPRCHGLLFLAGEQTEFQMPEIAGMALDDYFFGRFLYKFPPKLDTYQP